MPVNTASAAVHISPVVLKTFLKHTKRKGVKAKDGDKTVCAVDDIYYDEAFHIVKAFIELGTRNTVESLQAFTNTHVPAPYWVAVVPVKIPLSSCNRAADSLIDWFGPEELKHVVGGERWWQVRGLDWIDGEWITEKEFLEDTPVPDDVEQAEDEKTIHQMESLDRVMLYVHGGAFFWGSINTHRYQVIRYAKKFRGRAFSVNYRKAPQYPWPCPLQDVLAAYFYLTSPPPGSVHKAVQPSKLVLAGDSAGAGLCVSALTVLRDLGLPLPAGAVLISPWVDLTHSFPSVITNTATDIIPPHGFIHKPSTLWPVHPKLEGGYTRVVPTRTKPPPRPGHADKLKPNVKEAEEQVTERLQQSMERGNHGSLLHASELEDNPAEIPAQTEMQAQDDVDGPTGHSESCSALTTEVDPSDADQTEPQVRDAAAQRSADVALEFWEPKPPKVLMEDPNATPWELRAQIQLYATTEQLSHPLVSPVLQSTLGNLCPLYILAGGGECLRDEIIYLAHKAANPKEYPVRQGVLQQGHRQQENTEKFQTPTKVHLQVFDDMCHVLTVFTFTEPGKYAYRSIAEFVKHVIDSPGGTLRHHPFPKMDGPHSKDGGEDGVQPYPLDASKGPGDVKTGAATRESRPEHHARDCAEPMIFIRERVDALGKVRPMEPVGQLAALHLPSSEIGLIKEAPVRRWLTGQEAWDKRFQKRASAVLRKRKRYESKWEKLLEHAKQEGLFSDAPLRSTASVVSAGGAIELQRRWGPLDLENENPPPSAIAGRKDTREAVALLKKVIYHSAPPSHQQVPKMKVVDVIRAALDPNDSALKVPTQSVSEQQIRMRISSLHGLKLWQSIVEWFMRKSSEKVANGGQQAMSTLRSTVDKVTPAASSPRGELHSTYSRQ